MPFTHAQALSCLRSHSLPRTQRELALHTLDTTLEPLLPRFRALYHSPSVDDPHVEGGSLKRRRAPGTGAARRARA